MRAAVPTVLVLTVPAFLAAQAGAAYFTGAPRVAELWLGERAAGPRAGLGQAARYASGLAVSAVPLTVGDSPAEPSEREGPAVVWQPAMTARPSPLPIDAGTARLSGAPARAARMLEAAHPAAPGEAGGPATLAPAGPGVGFQVVELREGGPRPAAPRA